jgi:hypothetical protein
MRNGDLSAESPTTSSYGRVIVLVAVIALTLGFLFYALPQSTPSTQPTTHLPRSGPISTYPASWSIYSGCPGSNTQGNTTTLGLGRITYPNSWNTTTIVTLTQVYDSIIGSSAFVNATSGHGWVVYSWFFAQGGSNNPFPDGNTIVGFFILTNGVSPNGYVTAYYDIQNGEVSLSTPSTTVTLTVVCSAITTG